MVNYESVFIIDPDLTADATKGVVTQVQDLVGKQGGRIDGLQEWGKKRLTYKINKKSEGSYILLNYQMNSQSAKKFDQLIRLNDNIVRYMTINKDSD